MSEDWRISTPLSLEETAARIAVATDPVSSLRAAIWPLGPTKDGREFCAVANKTGFRLYRRRPMPIFAFNLTAWTRVRLRRELGQTQVELKTVSRYPARLMVALTAVVTVAALALAAARHVWPMLITPVPLLIGTFVVVQVSRAIRAEDEKRARLLIERIFAE